MSIKKCFYCGEDAEVRDHVIPYSFFRSGRRSGGGMGIGGNSNIVDSCRECNSLVSDKVFDNVYRKRDFIQGKLSERYKKVIKMANWTEQEISEMGVEFKTDLRLQMLAKKWIQNRINYPEIIFPEQPLREELRKILEKFGL